MGITVVLGDTSDYEFMAVGSATNGWNLIVCRVNSKSSGEFFRRFPFLQRAVNSSSDSSAVFT